MKHLGIITPLIPEAKWFIKSPTRKKTIWLADNISLMVCGEGRDNAGHCVKQLLKYGVDGLIVVGMAGALDPELSPGDIVIPDVVMTEANQLYHCHSDWSIQLLDQFQSCNIKIVSYPLITSDTVVSGSNEKKRLFEQFNTCAVDMESAEVVALANAQHIPCTVIRVIIDPASYSFPDYLLALTDEFGEVAISRLILAALAHPGQLNKLLQLQGFYRQACEILKIVAKNPENLIASPH